MSTSRPATRATSEALKWMALARADAYDLDRLPGIGPAKAEAILAYREEYGPFQSVDDLLSVSGIGEVTLENLRPYVTAGGAAETAEATGG